MINTEEEFQIRTTEALRCVAIAQHIWDMELGGTDIIDALEQRAADNNAAAYAARKEQSRCGEV